VTDLHVLRVFLGPDGRGGNPLGVFLDGGAIPPGDRLAVARDLGFSETVFVDAIDGDEARIAIFTPSIEMPFAGHPTVGTSWLLRRQGTPVSALHVPAGAVRTWADDELTWIRGRASWLDAFTIEQLGSAAEVEALTPTGDRDVYVWAWIDEDAGILRSRFFANEYGILEDEATGAAAVVMGDRIGRPLTIRQGVASELYVRPDPAAGTVDVGGRVVPVEVRSFGPSVP
jgi:predicted PhzF superfamily epimerase YddE/YHI9